MKISKLVFPLIMITALASCGERSGSNKAVQEQEEVQKMYICPMKCNSGPAASPGKCPKCGTQMQEVTSA
jgi:rubrerythrin